ncbi:biliverdin-producing heme oxygenase [Alcanivorax sp. MM125-6]|nr:biliverdin-producing heme oxygenase [Alcanivorax sp. MM125-6]
MVAILDLSQPLATLLREATKPSHDRANSSVGANRLLSGQLPKDQYIQFLMMLWHVYDTLERQLERHSTHPTLEPTYNPALLGRATPLESDISHLLQVPVSKWQSHPLHTSLMSNMPDQLRSYVDRIQYLSDSSDPSPLLAHSYARYLGDLSGGQIMRRTIAKAYDLDVTSGLGTEFYTFKQLSSSKKATQGDMKTIKDWFREGMNKCKSEESKTAVVNEALLAYDLNIGLFDTMEARTAAENENPASEKSEGYTSEQPLKTLDSGLEKTYPVASVVAFIAAACLAHFILVVGGFTGDKGYQKLVAITGWLSSIF